MGTDVDDVQEGDRVFGVPGYLGCSTASVAQHAVLGTVWKTVPAGLA